MMRTMRWMLYSGPFERPSSHMADKRVSDPLDLELQAVVSYLMWVLGP